MSEIRIISEDNGAAEVWLTMDGEPTLEGFCIGVGATYDDALADARTDLESTLERVRALQAGAHVPPEGAL